MATCVATRVDGQPCEALAVTGGDKCSFHLGAKIGHASKFTPATADLIVQLLSAGNYITVAVRAAGVSRQQFHEWLERGTSGLDADVEYADFRERVELAKAQGESRNVAHIASAARENWQAAAWLLERMYPDRWGRVSVRLRDAPEDAEPIERAADPDDPFSEVDQLAELRRRRGA
jgi:hypothetical protein